jgi:hypothetical protein
MSVDRRGPYTEYTKKTILRIFSCMMRCKIQESRTVTIEGGKTEKASYSKSLTSIVIIKGY